MSCGDGRSRWEKSPSYPAGEYEYIDVIAEKGERVLVDIDFRSEFEIARPTGNYRTILQSLPYIFVGRSDRIQQIVSHTRTTTPPPSATVKETVEQSEAEDKQCSAECDRGELDLNFGEITTSSTEKNRNPVDDEKLPVMTLPWQPPAVKPKTCDRGGKVVVTGLAKEKA